MLLHQGSRSASRSTFLLTFTGDTDAEKAKTVLSTLKAGKTNRALKGSQSQHNCRSKARILYVLAVLTSAQVSCDVQAVMAVGPLR